MKSGGFSKSFFIDNLLGVNESVDESKASQTATEEFDIKASYESTTSKSGPSECKENVITMVTTLWDQHTTTSSNDFKEEILSPPSFSEASKRNSENRKEENEESKQFQNCPYYPNPPYYPNQVPGFLNPAQYWEIAFNQGFSMAAGGFSPLACTGTATQPTKASATFHFPKEQSKVHQDMTATNRNGSYSPEIFERCHQISERQSSAPKHAPYAQINTSSNKPPHSPTSRRGRISFRPDQYQVLKQYFEKNKYIDEKTAEEIGCNSGLTINQVKKWFRNERVRFHAQRRKSEAKVEDCSVEDNSDSEVEVTI